MQPDQGVERWVWLSFDETLHQFLNCGFTLERALSRIDRIRQGYGLGFEKARYRKAVGEDGRYRQEGEIMYLANLGGDGAAEQPESSNTTPNQIIFANFGGYYNFIFKIATIIVKLRSN